MNFNSNHVCYPAYDNSTPLFHADQIFTCAYLTAHVWIGLQGMEGKSKRYSTDDLALIIENITGHYCPHEAIALAIDGSGREFAPAHEWPFLEVTLPTRLAMVGKPLGATGNACVQFERIVYLKGVESRQARLNRHDKNGICYLLGDDTGVISEGVLQ